MSNLKTVFALTHQNGRTYKTKVGVAYPNKDGSITVRLNALPISGTLEIRDREERQDTRGRSYSDDDYSIDRGY